MRRIRGWIVTTLVATMLLVGMSAAEAGEAKLKVKWRNCDETTSAVSVRATFTNPVRYYGKGKYMVKRWVEWEYYKSVGWREADREYTESSWLQINNPDYDWVTTAADRTKWGNLYYSSWRAKVTVKLIKNRRGPRDKKVDEIQIFPRKGVFREIGSNCGYEF